MLASRHACAIALAIVATAGGAARAAADPIAVSTTADLAAPNKPPLPGSLRDALMRANAGDTIVFEVSGPVVLKGRLRIGSHLTGLTITGPAVIDGHKNTIEVLADNVTLQNLTLRNVNVVAGNELEFTDGVRLLDNRFEGDSTVTIDLMRDCLVQRNTFELSKLNDAAISLFRTVRCDVGHNTLTGGGDKVHIEDAFSANLLIHDNTLAGEIVSRQRSGEIRANTQSGEKGITVFPSPPPSAGLSIRDNNGPWIRAQRTAMEIVGNTLELPEGAKDKVPLLKVDNFDPGGAVGPVLVERNLVLGGQVAIFYEEEVARSGPGMLRLNTARNCSDTGLSVRNGRSVQIVRNTIENCGTGVVGNGIAIHALANDVVASLNVIVDTKGVGILIRNTDGNVTLEENTVRSSTAAGLHLSGGLGRTFAVDNILQQNVGPGVALVRRARGSIVGGEISGNGGAGVLVTPNALAAVSRVTMHDNAEPGIDIAPRGVTANAITKQGNLDIDWPEQLEWLPDRLEGIAAAGSRVEVFIVEPGPRAGNPTNGEGHTFLGSALADATGRFVFPLPCAPGTVLTTTATLPADDPPVSAESHTSEFSDDVTCTLLPPPPGTDTDGDGVEDGIDQCPGTESGESVDANGCAESQLDGDHDGIADAIDNCPAIANSDQADADQDGIGDACDDSPYAPLTITKLSMSDGDVNNEYFDVILTSGGSGNFTYGIAAGELPPGVSVDPPLPGLLGTPTTGGYFTFTVEVRDNLQPAVIATREYTIFIMEVATTELPDAFLGQPYQAAVETRGLVDALWTLIVNDGQTGLPPGLSFGGFDQAGIDGIPTQVGTYTFTVEARRSVFGLTYRDEQVLTLVVKTPMVGVVGPISVSTDGQFDNGRPDIVEFGAPAITPNGRYVAFVSNGTNLVPGLTTSKNRVYLRDTCNNAPLGCTPSTILISTPREGTTDADVFFAEFPSISANGRYVVFFGRGKYAPYIDASFLDRSVQAFVRDTCIEGPSSCVPHTVTLPERPTFDAEGNQVIGRGQRVTPALRAISAHGRYVLIPGCSIDTALVCPDLPEDGSVGLLLHDRDLDDDGVFDEEGETANRLIVIPPDGENTVIPSRLFMSPDAAFISYLGTRGVPTVATLFVQAISKTASGFIARDEITAAAMRVGAEWNGPLSETTPYGFAGPHVFWAYSSAGGSGAGYKEDAFLAACDPSCYQTPVDVPSRDDSGTSANDAHPTDRTTDVSWAGRFVSFTTSGANLVAGDTNNTQDVYVFDSCVGAASDCVRQHRQVSLKFNGEQLAFGAYNQVLSGNGQYVVFANNGGDTNLVAGGNPSTPQLYIAMTGFSEPAPR